MYFDLSLQSERFWVPSLFKLLQRQWMDFTSFIHPMNEFSDNLQSSVLEVKGFVLNGFRVWECPPSPPPPPPGLLMTVVFHVGEKDTCLSGFNKCGMQLAGIQGARFGFSRTNAIQNLVQSPHLSKISPCSLARSSAPGLLAYEEIDLSKIGEESTHQDSTLVMHAHRERIHRRPRPRHHADATSMTCRVCSRITIGIFGHITTQSHAMDCRK